MLFHSLHKNMFIKGHPVTANYGQYQINFEKNIFVNFHYVYYVEDLQKNYLLAVGNNGKYAVNSKDFENFINS